MRKTRNVGGSPRASKHELCTSKLVALLAAAVLGGALAGCAASPPAKSSSRPSTETTSGRVAQAESVAGSSEGASEIRIRVIQVRGSATVTRNGRPVALREGSVVATDQRIQVGSNSSVRLNIADQGLFELGPSARFTVQELPNSALFGNRDTRLRLERGYLHIVWAEPAGLRGWPLELSVSRWAAKLSPGEFFFEGSADRAAACAAAGELAMSGTATPAMTAPCVSLRAGRAPVSLSPDASQWTAVRRNHALQPLIAKLETASTAAAAPGRGPEKVAMVVQHLHGSVTVSRDARRVALRKGATLREGQPVSVAPSARISLALADRGRIDVGPSSRMVVYALPQIDGGGDTRLRLEEGRMHVLWNGGGEAPQPFQLSVGRWAVKLAPGEYAIEGAADRATLCVMKGDAAFSGAAETIPTSMSKSCVRLRASEPPEAVGAEPATIEAMRDGAPVETALASQQRREAAAVAATERAARAEERRIARAAKAGAAAVAVASAPRPVEPAPSAQVPVVPPIPPPALSPAPAAQIASAPTPPAEPAPRIEERPRPPALEVRSAPVDVAAVSPPAEPLPPTEPSREASPPVSTAERDASAEAAMFESPDRRQEVSEAPPAMPEPETAAEPTPAVTASEPSAPVEDAASDEPPAPAPQFDGASAVTVAASVSSAPRTMPSSPPSAAPAVAAIHEAPTPTPADAPTSTSPSSAFVSESIKPATLPSATAAGAETTVAMTEPASPAPSVSGEMPEWIVNAGSYPEPEKGQQLLELLRQAGYPAALRTEIVRGMPSYRVVVNGIDSETKANQVVRDLERRGLGTAWALRTR